MCCHVSISCHSTCQMRSFRRENRPNRPLKTPCRLLPTSTSRTPRTSLSSRRTATRFCPPFATSWHATQPCRPMPCPDLSTTMQPLHAKPHRKCQPLHAKPHRKCQPLHAKPHRTCQPYRPPLSRTSSRRESRLNR